MNLIEIAIYLAIGWFIWKKFLQHRVQRSELFRNLKAQAAARDIPDEAYFEMADAELRSGHLRKGLWLQAQTESCGNDSLARARYVELRVQAMRREAAKAIQAVQDEERLQSGPSDTNSLTGHRVITCPSCTKQMRVPARRELEITCPHCKSDFSMKT